LVEGRTSRVFLSRPAASVVTVRELAGSDWTELTVDDDYTVNGGVLTRVDQRWGRDVEVTYTPANDAAMRMSIQIQLVQLALNYEPHLVSEGGGSFSEQFAQNSVYNYELEKAAILAPLRRATGMVVV
jgi:hypothetical protein